MSEPVRVEIEGSLTRVVLARPEVHNALDEATIDALHRAISEASGASRVLVLQGDGKSFCAGADLAYMKRARDLDEIGNLEDARRLAHLFEAIRGFPGTVIAAVHGATFGGGVGLVAACDVVLASTAATFALSEVKLGLVPAVISPFLIARMGEGRCRAPALLGYRFGAQEALARGLVDRVVEPETFATALRELENDALGTAPEAVRETKALFRRIADGPEDAVEETARTIARIRAGDEAQHGLACFLDKKKPRWQMEPPRG